MYLIEGGIRSGRTARMIEHCLERFAQGKETWVVAYDRKYLLKELAKGVNSLAVRLDIINLSITSIFHEGRILIVNPCINHINWEHMRLSYS